MHSALKTVHILNSHLPFVQFLHQGKCWHLLHLPLPWNPVLSHSIVMDADHFCPEWLQYTAHQRMWKGLWTRNGITLTIIQLKNSATYFTEIKSIWMKTNYMHNIYVTNRLFTNDVVKVTSVLSENTALYRSCPFQWAHWKFKAIFKSQRLIWNL